LCRSDRQPQRSHPLLAWVDALCPAGQTGSKRGSIRTALSQIKGFARQGRMLLK
jgi:hypothetical protein